MDNFAIFSVCVAIGLSVAVATYLARFLHHQGFALASDDRFLGLDGLRGYLALSVMMSHFIVWLNIVHYGADWTYPPVHFFNHLGGGAVVLFFMVTGFLFYPLVRDGFFSVAWHIFLLKRLFRIVPLAFIAMSMSFIILAWRSELTPSLMDFGKMLKWIFVGYESSVFNDPNAWRVQAGVFWTLEYEWKFYVIIVPLSSLIVQFLPKRIPPLVLPILLILIGIIKIERDWAGFLILFAMGMLVRAVLGSATLQRVVRTKYFAGLTLLAMVGVVNLFHIPFGNAAAVGYLFFFAAVTFENPIFDMLKEKSCQVLGACSFGIYVTHGMILSLLFTEGASYIAELPMPLLLLLLPIVTAVTVLISAWLHVWIERPAIAAGARIAGLLRLGKSQARFPPNR